ncbi:hypothetical protein [Aromatoleum evansii]|uniref:hypothetical protein n=1 Tax=Aromatoleum evansii TaxID=59406 RepID=UPI00145D9CD7|nr:hypothetical protein [Aromatoleum evansii]NMG27934.1 hypothetical protein [Aromatoleum evansii]
MSSVNDPIAADNMQPTHDEIPGDSTPTTADTESKQEETITPRLEIGFLALDGEPIAKMGVAIRWSDGELIARTDAGGSIPPIEAPPGETLTISVQRLDGSYKELGECRMPSSDGVLTAVSPNIVLETATERHEGKPGDGEDHIPRPVAADRGDLIAQDKPPNAHDPAATQAEPAKTDTGPTITVPPKSSSIERSSTSQPSAKRRPPPSTGRKSDLKPRAPSGTIPPRVRQKADRPPQHISGRTGHTPTLEKRRDQNGNPLAVMPGKVLDWWNSWRMPTFNLWGASTSETSTQAHSAGGTTPVTAVAVNSVMIKQVQTLLEFAREQTEYDYKATGERTADVLASMNKGTFNHRPGEKRTVDSSGLCYTYVKIALARCKIVDGMLVGESASGAAPTLLAKGFKDVSDDVPDARWAAAGDVIVYEWTESNWEKRKAKNPTIPNYGHIDIRDYEFYISDFIPAPPKHPGHHPAWSNYQNIRIFRKIFDPLPIQRIRAFLRCIRDFECQAESDDSKRYQMLNAPLPTGNKRFSSYATHPWEGLQKPTKGSTAAGAYQIIHGTWKEIFDKGLMQYAGDLFSPLVQDRLAVMKLEDRGALHLVRTGKIREAVSCLTSEWTSLPGGKENAHRTRGGHKPMDMAYFESLFEEHLRHEIVKS